MVSKRKKKVSGLEAAANAAYFADKLLRKAILLFVLTMALVGGYGLWDNAKLKREASADGWYKELRPYGEEEPLNFRELQRLNPDVCAWITVDGAGIDYPVVQGKTNLQYLNRDVKGEFSLSGSIFLDCRNRRNFEDAYSLLYGHHMAGDVMFGGLRHFLKKSFFQKHQKGTLYVEDKKYAVKWFACVYTDAYDETAFTPLQSADAGEREAFLKGLRKKAKQYRDIPISDADSIIGLSTCYDTSTNGRILLLGRIKGKKGA